MEVKEKDEIVKELQGIRTELVGLKRKGIKQIFSVVIAIIISVAIGVGGGFYVARNWDDIMLKLRPGMVAQEKITLIDEKLAKEAKLITASDTITAKYDSGKIYKTVLGKKVPLSSKSFTFTYTGTIEAGIKDLKKTKVMVDPEKQIVNITLPKIEITNRSIDTKNLNTSDQTKNFFNQITLQDFNNAQETLKNRMQEQAIKSGILDKAKENAEQVIRDLLADLTKDYQVQISWAG